MSWKQTSFFKDKSLAIDPFFVITESANEKYVLISIKVLSQAGRMLSSLAPSQAAYQLNCMINVE